MKSKNGLNIQETKEETEILYRNVKNYMIAELYYSEHLLSPFEFAVRKRIVETNHERNLKEIEEHFNVMGNLKEIKDDSVWDAEEHFNVMDAVMMQEKLNEEKQRKGNDKWNMRDTRLCVRQRKYYER